MQAEAGYLGYYQKKETARVFHTQLTRIIAYKIMNQLLDKIYCILWKMVCRHSGG